MKSLNKTILSLSCAILAMSLASCIDGVEPGSFSTDVRNQQVATPQLDASSFSTVMVAEGTEKVAYTRMTWPVVHGAYTYVIEVDITDDPNNIVHVVTDTVDGCSFNFVQAEESQYRIKLKALGRKSLHNTDSEVLVYNDYNTYVPGYTIPAGEDIAAFVREHITYGSMEQLGFALEAGATYEVKDTIDLGLSNIQLRGSKVKRPTLIFSNDACIVTQGPLSLKHIDFDFTQSVAAPISLSANPDSSIFCLAKYRSFSSVNQNVFYIDGAIQLSNCNFRGVQGMFLYGNKKPWALLELSINNCIIETSLDEKDKSIFNLWGSSTGGIKKIEFSNTTLYNLKPSSQSYFLRFSNPSNAIPEKIWGTKEATVDFTNCTIVQAMSEKDWWNNYVNKDCAIWTLKGNIFYETVLIQKAIRNGTANFEAADNVIWSTIRDVDNTDAERYATKDDPGMKVPTASVALKDMETTLKGYFKPTEANSVAVKKQYGDPRYWK